MIDDSVIVALITLIGTLAGTLPITQRYRAKAAGLARLIQMITDVMADGKVTKEEAQRLLTAYKALHGLH